jgi:putative NIF3 family GTP cyclohydrolase 1 type 2
MNVKSITALIEAEAPLSLQESYDNAGLLVGNPAMEVNAVLITIDVTEEVVDEAIAKNCNLIIALYPL